MKSANHRLQSLSPSAKESKLEEDQNSENLEVTTHDHDATIVNNDVPVEQENQTEEIQNDTQEKNWKEMRRKDQENQQKMKLQDEVINKLLQNAQTPQPIVQQSVAPIDEFEAIDDSEYLSKGDSRKMIRQDAQQIARDEFMRLEKARDDANFLNRLKSRYSDFSDVVNAETIAKFEKQNPELSSTIADLKDNYKMGLQTYNFIKSMKINTPDSEDRHAKEVQKKIMDNEKTIQSPQAYTKRPMAAAFSLTNMSDDEKKAIYEEQMGYASQAGGVL